MNRFSYIPEVQDGTSNMSALSFANLLSRFQFSGLFFFSVFSTLGRGRKVWLSKFSVPVFCSLPKHKASISWVFCTLPIGPGAFATAGSGRNGGSGAECPSTSESSSVEELVEDWMDWKCWLCSDNLTQDARMPGCQPPRMRTYYIFFRIRNPQLLGPSWLPRLHPGAQVSWSEIVGALVFVDLEEEELWRSWKLDAINQISGCFS